MKKPCACGGKCQDKKPQPQFSGFSLFGVCFDEACKTDKIKSDCGKIWEGQQEFIDECIQQKTDEMNQSSSSSSGVADKLAGLLGIFGIGPKTTSTPSAPAPPPSDNKLILGMDPLVATGVIVGTGALLVWGIVALTRKKAA